MTSICQIWVLRDTKMKAQGCQLLCQSRDDQKKSPVCTNTGRSSGCAHLNTTNSCWKPVPAQDLRTPLMNGESVSSVGWISRSWEWWSVPESSRIASVRRQEIYGRSVIPRYSRATVYPRKFCRRGDFFPLGDAISCDDCSEDDYLHSGNHTPSSISLSSKIALLQSAETLIVLYSRALHKMAITPFEGIARKVKVHTMYLLQSLAAGMHKATSNSYNLW